MKIVEFSHAILVYVERMRFNFVNCSIVDKWPKKYRVNHKRCREKA